MKKPAVISMIAFLTWTPMMVQAGQNTDSAQDHGSCAHKLLKKLASILGKFGNDDKTFTTDKDSKIWKVNNREALSGIDGRHVKVRAHVNAAQNQIRIVSVSAIAAERGGTKFGDPIHRTSPTCNVGIWDRHLFC